MRPMSGVTGGTGLVTVMPTPLAASALALATVMLGLYQAPLARWLVP